MTKPCSAPVCLGIESTAHTLGIGISHEGKILSNSKRMYLPKKGQGIIPREAADHHANFFGEVLSESLFAAGVSLSDIDLYAFSRGPGIGQCLRVSCAAAKYLAARHRKPVLGINHCQAHLEICKGLLSMENPLFIYVSGANTQLIVENRESFGRNAVSRYSVLGETLDMGLGNLFDVFAREAGINPPHGSEVAKLSERGSYFPLPYTVKGMNFSFAGLLSSAVKEVANRKAENICHSLMETAFAEICEASERALCLTGSREVTVCGGVAQNRRFCEMISIMCEGQGARFATVEPEYNADNGAMIAYTAEREFSRGKQDCLRSLSPDGYWRVDEVFW